MKIEITESASDDISSGHLFYELQQAGLGYYFESSIMSDNRSLVVYAGIHEIHLGEYHRKDHKTFPLCDLLPHRGPHDPSLCGP